MVAAVNENARSVTIWDTTTGEAITTRRQSRAPSAMAFHPDGTALAIGSPGGQILLWDLSAVRAARRDLVAEAELRTGLRVDGLDPVHVDRNRLMIQTR